jgi:hexosaminidase
MKKVLLVILLTGSLLANAQQINIIPQPVSIEPGMGSFTITTATKIVLAGTGTNKTASFLNSYLQKFYGFQLALIKSNNGQTNNTILLKEVKGTHNIQGGYSLAINNKNIVITGDNGAGVFYAIQSLIQLLPLEKTKALIVPQLTIIDSARFAYRGMHLDVGRHFLPVEFVKKYIDFIAMHKMNTFHWHLTEDQGWRIEIKKYPKLTSVGAFRNGTIIGRYPGTGNDGKREGGFYTQEQIKEVVKYAADRYITVIPEIELPGHSSAAIAAYPQLSCFPEESTKHPEKTAWNGSTEGKQVQQAWGVFEDVFAPTEYTFHFLQDVLDEVMQLFPSTYIHIGGDECPKESWKRSAFCQQLIKDKGLKDEHGLQSYFIGRIEKYLNSKGRQIIGWDEILEGGLAPNATVMSWRGEQGGIDAAKQKHKVIMTPGGWVYFDHSQTKNEDSVTIGGYTTVQKVYGYEPIPAALSETEAQYVLGAQANLWTEYISNPQKAEYMIFPRMSALSEVLWSPKRMRNWDNFEKKLPILFKRYDWWGWNYSKAYFDVGNK